MLKSHLPRDPVHDNLLVWAQLYRRVFLGTPEGEKVFDHLVTHLCGIHAPLMVDKDEMATLRNVARHDIGAQLLRLVYAPIDDTKPTVRR